MIGATTKRKPMTEARRLRIFLAHDGICVRCRQKIDGIREAWTVEHDIPLGLAGKDEDANCGPSHERCRREKDREDIPRIAKAKRQQAKYLGARKSGRPMPGSRRSQWKRKMDGTTERRP